MTCSYPRCECMYGPEDCVFLEKNRKRIRMASTSQYVIDRRLHPELMDEKDRERLDRAEDKRRRRALAAHHQSNSRRKSNVS